MDATFQVDLQPVAAGLRLQGRQVASVVSLLDDGNTVPFITRYRKDQTGGLDEEQIREIQSRVSQLRMLVERKQTILRSIESQGKLTEELSAAIHAAKTVRELEDLYLPYKPKKQTLATAARERGLEPLAREILEADKACADLDQRAADFIDPDKKVATIADALLGAGHILAEMFSERAALRGQLRQIIEKSGVLVSSHQEEKPEKEEKPSEPAAEQTPAEAAATPEMEGKTESKPDSVETKTEGESAASAAETTAESQPADTAEPVVAAEPPAPDSPTAEMPGAAAAPEQAEPAPTPEAAVVTPEVATPEPPAPEAATPAEPVTGGETPPNAEATATPASQPPASNGGPETAVSPATAEGQPTAESTPPPAESKPAPSVAQNKPAKSARQTKQEKRKAAKAKEKADRAKEFRDYFDYKESIKKVPPHRVLAINRGERAKVLRVKVDADFPGLESTTLAQTVPEGHPHADFLRGCAMDALWRLIFPSLEREIRRELTDRAEEHAVRVFARNLRNLLLQPPIRNKRVLAVDPGFRTGCKLAALDECGNLLAHGVAFLAGKKSKPEEGKELIKKLVEEHQLSVVAIGNGTACREAEEFIAGMIANEFAGRELAYVIVNEAGASIYSASTAGREEFPDFDATLRGTISIGRRLQDPLSELVKIEPQHLGVGLYQHDVKQRHLQLSLDEVVESAVNYVGVDLNTASVALLRYVSGLNQLTARRLVEQRQQQGAFQNRAQLKEVAGIGDATYTQAAGFLKIASGEQPLDRTWIHPESYEATLKLLEKLGFTTDDLTNKEKIKELSARLAEVNADELAGELEIGPLAMKDIIANLVRPGRDPREDLPPPVFKKGVLRVEDLSPGMELTGTVLNVVDFGSFVDIGLKDSGLVHISELADRYVQDPHEVVAVGDVVRVWVLAIDKERKRVSLSMISPEAKEAAKRQREQRKQQRAEQRKRKPEGARQGGGGRQAARQGGKPRGGRPPRGGQKQYTPRPKPKPKPLKPLTKGMIEGKEPLRTFGDLMQLYEKKKQDDQEPPKEEEQG